MNFFSSTFIPSVVQSFFFCLLLAITAAAQQTNRALSLQELDDSLRGLESQKFLTHIDQKQANENHSREIALIDAFESRGPEAIDFLLSRLDQINGAEKKNMANPDDLDGAMADVDPKQLIMRFAYCYMLSDMYGPADLPHKHRIIVGIVNSFLPTTQGREDAEGLSGSLFRIGKDGARGFMMLANSDSKRNRCIAEGVINGLGDSPKIDCNAPIRERKKQVERFHKWWERNSARVSWPAIPNLFFYVPKKPQ